VTPSGVRDGDPAALAGLCDRRGPAVLAYCRHVAGDAEAAAAAAEAFGSFRAAVHAAEDPADINPEALLLNTTRHAAAGRVGIVALGICAVVPLLLAARADRSISPADLDQLEEHLRTCWTCRAPVARFEAAERAYRDPPAAKVPPEAAAVIVAALTAAAPVRAEEPPPPAPPPLTAAGSNGSGHLAAADGRPPADRLDMPTTEFRRIDEIAPVPAPAPAVPVPDDEPPPSPPARRGAGAVAGLLSGLRARATRDRGAAAVDPAAAAEIAAAAAVPAAASGARASSARRRTRAPRPAGETHLPRPQRAQASARRERSAGRPAGRPHRALRPSVVLPIVLIALALVIALFVAGVFGADDPTPSSSVVPPVTAPPAAKKKPEVVVVSGSGDASGAAVERAKSRARAKDRRQTQAGANATAPAASTPPAAVATPAPTRTPPAAAPASKPKPAGTKTGGTGTGIDANNGATGAEQLPPAQDTSTVPELAPPDPAAPVPPG
jgi:hypothetical protein